MNTTEDMMGKKEEGMHIQMTEKNVQYRFTLEI